MKINVDELNSLLMHSSEVESIEQNSPIVIQYCPHRIYLDTTTLKVILCPAIFRRSTKPHYNPKENIIFFANEVHLRMSLQHWGLDESILDEFIEELTIQEEIVKEATLEKFAVPLFQKKLGTSITLLFIMLIEQRRIRKSKFPYLAPLGQHVPAEYFFYLKRIYK